MSVMIFASPSTKLDNNFSACSTKTLTSSERALMMRSLYFPTVSSNFFLMTSNAFLKAALILSPNSLGKSFWKKFLIFSPRLSKKTFTLAKSAFIFTPNSWKNFTIFAHTILNQSPILSLTSVIACAGAAESSSTGKSLMPLASTSRSSICASK